MVTVDETLMKMGRSIGRRVARSSRGLVEQDDLQMEAVVWALKNRAKVEQWLDEGPVGKAKLNTAMYRAAQRAVSKERCRVTGSMPGDAYYYTPEIVRDLLPEVFNYDGWDYSAPAPRDDKVSTGSAPNEGNNWLAMLVDIKWAYASLSADDQIILRHVFSDGLSAVQIGELLDCTDDTVRNRTDRAVERLSDRLGGAPPWWSGGRKARSNANAQHETRGQE